MVMDETVEKISIDLLDLFDKPQYIAIDKCCTGTVQARQQGTDVKDDNKLVDSIRATGGVIHPIIVQDNKNDTFEIIVGQRRTSAYHILREEDPKKYENIRAYVVERALTDDEIKIISFVECYGRSDMEKVDYASVIEYFYRKYGRSVEQAGKALGLSTKQVKKYLAEARLPEKVKEAMRGDDGFSIDVAMKALKGMGDDEESVDPDVLIEIARILKKVKPGIRNKAVKKMRDKGMDAETAVKEVFTAVKEAASTTTFSIEFSDDMAKEISELAKNKGCDSSEEWVINIIEKEMYGEPDD